MTGFLDALTLKDVLSLVAAVVGALAIGFGAVLVRRSTKDQITATLIVSAKTAKIEADKLELSAKQLQAQREEMVTEITERMGKLYNGLLNDANMAIDRLTARVDCLERGLAECETRDAGHRDRLARIEDHARQMGWELP